MPSLVRSKSAAPASNEITQKKDATALMPSEAPAAGASQSSIEVTPHANAASATQPKKRKSKQQATLGAWFQLKATAAQTPVAPPLKKAAVVKESIQTTTNKQESTTEKDESETKTTTLQDIAEICREKPRTVSTRLVNHFDENSENQKQPEKVLKEHQVKKIPVESVVEVSVDVVIGDAPQEAAKDDDVAAEPATVPTMEAVVESRTAEPPKKQPRRQAAEKTSPKMAQQPADVMPVELPAEQQEAIEKNNKKKAKFKERALEIQQLILQGVEEEKFDIDVPKSAEPLPETDWTAFPDAAIESLAPIVEGSPLCLSKLALVASGKLSELYETHKFTVDMVQQKIQLVASRIKYVKDPASRQCGDPVNVFENEESEFMWRWEIIMPELLPAAQLARVKRARSARKKIASHLTAATKVMATIDQINKLVTDCKKTETVIAKLSKEEERFLKFEQDEQKAALAKEAKRLKQQARMEKQAKKLEKEATKQAERQEAHDRRKEKEQAKLEKQRAKEQATEAKRKKAELEAKKKQKQQSMLMSFVKTGAKKDASPSKTPTPKAAKPASSFFDVEAFRSKVNDDDAPVNPHPFAKLSARSRKSRRRTVKGRSLTVFVSVTNDDDAFKPQAFAEQREVSIRNRLKFLSFREDVRPPYHGTWSKTSRAVTGRTPFGKDAVFDYEYDSEAEWEEGDDDFGEDIGNEADDEDDKHLDGEDDEDGWLAADDEMLDGLDEETKLLRRQKLGTMSEQRDAKTVCVIAPCCGRPATEADAAKFEGFSLSEGLAFLEAHSALVVSSDPVHLEDYPPAMIDESGAPEAKAKREMTLEGKKTFAMFVHGSTSGSKDNLINELREKHPEIISSRAQAFRYLESVASKVKLSGMGAVWQVKSDVLRELGLEDLIGSATVEADNAKKQRMVTVASIAHQSTTSSKDKLVDEIQADPAASHITKAEIQRIIEAIAEKKSHPEGGVIWEVKDSACSDLGIAEDPEFPPDTPAYTEKAAPVSKSVALPEVVKPAVMNVLVARKKRVRATLVSSAPPVEMPSKHQKTESPAEKARSMDASMETATAADEVPRSKTAPTAAAAPSSTVPSEPRKLPAGSKQLLASFLKKKQQSTN